MIIIKNLFLHKICCKNIDSENAILLPVKLMQTNLNLLFIKNDSLQGYRIKTVKHTSSGETKITLTSSIPIDIEDDFSDYLYSDYQLRLNSKEESKAIPLSQNLRGNFKFAYVTINFTQATQKNSLPILNAYIENLRSKQVKEHQAKLEKKTSQFSYYLNPFEYKEDIPTKVTDNVITYAKVIQVDDEYHLTLTNDKMLYLDYLYAISDTEPLAENVEKLVKSYKPYFYEFIPEDPMAFKGSYSEKDIYYVVEFNSNKNAIPGTIEFSASAFQYLSTAVQLKNSIQTDAIKDLHEAINNKISPFIEYDCESKVTAALAPILNSNSVNNLGVTLFDVGNANAIQLSINNKVKAIIDFGFSNQKENQSEIDAFMTHIKDIDLILLTHWDLDHIKGISQFELSDYNKIWIIPEPPVNKVSHAASRLICYLVTEIHTDNLIIVSKTNNEKKIIAKNPPYFTLGKGSGRGKRSIVHRNDTKWVTRYTDLNNLGLVLSLSNNKGESILFPGDCEYSEFPEDMQIHYTHLIATHHGAKVNAIALPEDDVTNKNVYFCAKMDNKYPHPDHIRLLKNYGYTLNQEKHITLNT